MKATTIKDVARLANVAPSTVSRVISDNPKISNETKKRVRAAMKKLDYKPNQIARSLTNKSTKTLGLILPSSNQNILTNPFFIQAIQGISVYAKKRGYFVLLAHSDENENDIELLNNLVFSKWVDGVILTTLEENDKRVEFLQSNTHPFVVIGRPEDEENILWVDNNNIKAMYTIVDELINTHHKTIAFLGGADKFKVTKNRLSGYLQALNDHHIEPDPKLIYEKDYTEQGAYDATIKLLKHKIPDAIVTTDDLIAFGAQRALIEHNLANISLIGFNNTSLSQYKVPSISSVDINAEKLGKYATKLLIDKIENIRLTKQHYTIETKLIKRDSTKF